MNDIYSLNVYFDGDAIRIQDLPRGVYMGTSFCMSTRTHDNAGLPLEDLGVVPDELHHMTRKDLIEGNIDLIEHAARILKDMAAAMQ